MKNPLIFTLIFLICSISTQASDPFVAAMNKAGISQNELGYRPQGHWTRYPHRDIPYRLAAFDGLMANPQQIYDFIRNMALATEKYSNPDYMTQKHLGILKTSFYCGIAHKTTQLRAYNASLWNQTDSAAPLYEVVRDIYLKAGAVFQHNVFGNRSDFPLIDDSLKYQISRLDPRLRGPVAVAVQNISDAVAYRHQALRRVDWQQMAMLWNVRDLGETQFDGLEFFGEIDDISRDIDMNLMYAASYKLSQATQQLADTIQALLPKLDRTLMNFNFLSPFGRIVISGTGNDIYNYNDCVLLVDLGGDDTYIGPAGATASLTNGISVLLDVSGDDKYLNTANNPAQGSAIFGAALLYDLAGNDTYETDQKGQGYGFFGVGILADLKGNDIYTMKTSGQGAAYFGTGLCMDISGDDSFKMYGDGQGYGGVSGVGALINYEGNDKYYAEADAKIVNRPDYHSKNGEHNYTFCQGAGVGRRGDLEDGHSWAGGLGLLIDIHGDDEYISGNWSQGCGYWYGIGMLYDKEGNDYYKSTNWSQACGAHFCIGAFVDESGDDKHEIWEQIGTGMAFGHDYTIALFLDRSGNDSYKLASDGLGYAINMSQVYFIDGAGDDEYITEGKLDKLSDTTDRYKLENTLRQYGWNNYRHHNPPGPESYYHLYSDQIAMFLDFGGKDKYLKQLFDGDETTPDPRMKDNYDYLYPTKQQKSLLSNQRYFGIGLDMNDADFNEAIYFRNKSAVIDK